MVNHSEMIVSSAENDLHMIDIRLIIGIQSRKKKTFSSIAILGDEWFDDKILYQSIVMNSD